MNLIGTINTRITGAITTINRVIARTGNNAIRT